MYLAEHQFNNQEIKDRLKPQRPTIAYFTQPYNKPGEADLISSLEDLSLIIGLDLIIIYHPRDSKSEFRGKPATHVKLLANDEYLSGKSEYDQTFVFVITRHSNIGLRFIFQGIPVINIHHRIDSLVVRIILTGILFYLTKWNPCQMRFRILIPP